MRHFIRIRLNRDPIKIIGRVTYKFRCLFTESRRLTTRLRIVQPLRRSRRPRRSRAPRGRGAYPARSRELKTSIVTSHRHGDPGGDRRTAVIHNGAHLFVISSWRRIAETKDGARRRGTKSNPFDNRSPRAAASATAAVGALTRGCCRRRRRRLMGQAGERMPRCCCSFARDARAGKKVGDPIGGGGRTEGE